MLTSDKKLLFSSQKILSHSEAGVAQLFIILFLVLGLIIGVFAVQKARTVLNPKAYEQQDAFRGQEKMYFTQDFPSQVEISLCRGNDNPNAGVWKVGNQTDQADYKNDGWSARCSSDVQPISLVFSKPVPQGAYVKLCVPGESNAWIWLVNDSGTTADSKNPEPYNRCGAPPQPAPDTNSCSQDWNITCCDGKRDSLECPNNSTFKDLGFEYWKNEACATNGGYKFCDVEEPSKGTIAPPNLEPKVISVASSTRCGNSGAEITWTWELENATDNVAWVYGGVNKKTGEGLIPYKGGSNNGRLTVRSLDSGGDYELALKAVNTKGGKWDESPVFAGDGIRQKAAEGCAKMTVQSRFAVPPAGRCSEGVGPCAPSALTAFGANAREASIICNAESHGDPNVVSPPSGTGSDRGEDVGLFQIHIYYNKPYSGGNLVYQDEFGNPKESLKDASKNIAVALQKFNARGWQPWSTKGCLGR